MELSEISTLTCFQFVYIYSSGLHSTTQLKLKAVRMYRLALSILRREWVVHIIKTKAHTTQTTLMASQSIQFTVCKRLKEEQCCSSFPQRSKGWGRQRYFYGTTSVQFQHNLVFKLTNSLGVFALTEPTYCRCLLPSTYLPLLEPSEHSVFAVFLLLIR